MTNHDSHAMAFIFFILAVDSWFLGISAGIALFVALGLILEGVLWVRHREA